MQYSRRTNLFVRLRSLPERFTVYQLRCAARIPLRTVRRWCSDWAARGWVGVIGEKAGFEWEIKRDPLIAWLVARGRMRIIPSYSAMPQSKEIAMKILEGFARARANDRRGERRQR